MGRRSAGQPGMGVWCAGDVRYMLKPIISFFHFYTSLPCLLSLSTSLSLSSLNPHLPFPSLTERGDGPARLLWTHHGPDRSQALPGEEPRCLPQPIAASRHRKLARVATVRTFVDKLPISDDSRRLLTHSPRVTDPLIFPLSLSLTLSSSLSLALSPTVCPD